MQRTLMRSFDLGLHTFLNLTSPLVPLVLTLASIFVHSPRTARNHPTSITGILKKRADENSNSLVMAMIKCPCAWTRDQEARCNGRKPAQKRLNHQSLSRGLAFIHLQFHPS
jgi:hypothetical protein